VFSAETLFFVKRLYQTEKKYLTDESLGELPLFCSRNNKNNDC